MNPDSETPSELTPGARNYLKHLLDCRKSPPTVWDVCRQNARVMITLILFFGGLAALAYAVDLQGLAIFTLGILAGCLLRDFQAFRRSVHHWPMSEAILDWPRIEKMLDESDRDH
jgi:hypothetical protein